MIDVVRAFLAMEVPVDVKTRLAKARENIRATLPASRWTRPEGWHITLKFLGATDRDHLAGLAADLASGLMGMGVVRARLAGGGFFPSPGHPRVAWIGGSAEGAARVVAEVEAATVRAGFPGEQRPWQIHLTMARLKGRWSAAAVDRYLEWANGLEPEAFDCTEAVLFASRPEAGGAVYTALERFSLE